MTREQALQRTISGYYFRVMAKGTYGNVTELFVQTIVAFAACVLRRAGWAFNICIPQRGGGGAGLLRVDWRVSRGRGGLLLCDVMESCSGAWWHLLRPCASQHIVHWTVGVVDLWHD